MCRLSLLKVMISLSNHLFWLRCLAKQDAAPVIPAVCEDDSLNSKLKVTFGEFLKWFLCNSIFDVSDRNSTSFKWSMVDGKMCLEIETSVGVNPLVVESSWWARILCKNQRGPNNFLLILLGFKWIICFIDEINKKSYCLFAIVEFIDYASFWWWSFLLFMHRF
jgi:hypothetical protein